MLRGEWNYRFIEELRMFPNGVNDDQVDGFSRAFMELIGRAPIRISDATLRKFA
jgi:phage terminase large subunit-like protein